tara:strand:+ start:355228 stop:355425 length:198 start_codon:yes stop_codon:yes gene_type:complete
MASFEEEFYLENPTRWQALRRDIRLLCLLARYAVMWLTRGAGVRRAYRRAQSSGEPLTIETVIED